MRMQHDRTVAGILLLGASLAAAGFGVRHQIQIGGQRDGSIVVPNGQLLTPAGTHIEVNDRPLGMVLSPNHKTLAVVTGSNFNARALHLIDIDSRTLTQTVSISNSFVGVGFSPSGDTIYVGGGASNDVKIFTSGAGGVFAAAGTIPIARAEPSGLSVSPNGSRLYVALNMTNEVAVIDTATRSVLQRIPVGTYPYTTVVSADGSKVYATNWGGKIPGPGDVTDGMFPVVVDPRTGIPMTGTVSVIDAASNAVVKTLSVGLHPTGLALSPGGDRVYVTNANSDTVSEINTATNIVVGTLHVGGTEGREPLLGASPNAVVVTPNGRSLFVANASQNAIAVVDVDGHSGNGVRGLIPTGWYPTAVALDATGDRLFIASGYGFGSIAPTTPPGQGRSYQDRVGVISILDVPNRQELARFTKQVHENNDVLPPSDDILSSSADGDGHDGDLDGHGNHGDHDKDRHGPSHDPIPMHLGEPSPIKHVFYIIKENRTYDQVFGDMPQGNGDSSLVEFGRDVTPNHHALAEQFALLDNYFGPGDQSALGHRWVLQSYPSTWVHKVRKRAQQPEPDAARTYRRDLRQREAEWAARARVRRAWSQRHHAVDGHLDRYLQRLEERHIECRHCGPGDHRRTPRRVSPAISRRREPGAGSVSRGHLPEGVC